MASLRVRLCTVVPWEFAGIVVGMQAWKRPVNGNVVHVEDEASHWCAIFKRAARALGAGLLLQLLPFLSLLSVIPCARARCTPKSPSRQVAYGGTDDSHPISVLATKEPNDCGIPTTSNRYMSF